MRAGRVFLGCGIAAAVAIVVAVVSGIVLFRSLSGPAQLPASASFVDENTVGFGVALMKPDDPWVQAFAQRASRNPFQKGDPAKIFPVEIIWTARRLSPSQEGHLVDFSLAPGGRLFGLGLDLALWQLGRSEKKHVARVEYGGEGITSFPGTPVKGHVFVSGNQVVWASDLDTARKGVDLMAPPKEGPGTAPSRATPAVYELAGITPQGPKGTLSGALANENGSLSRALALLPGGSMAFPPEAIAAVAAISFDFKTTSADEGAGEVVLHYAPGTAQAAAEKIASDFAAGLSTFSPGGVTFEVAHRLEADRAVLTVKAAGLESIAKNLKFAMVELGEAMQKSKDEEWEGSGAARDPNQPAP